MAVFNKLNIYDTKTKQDLQHGQQDTAGVVIAAGCRRCFSSWLCALCRTMRT